MKLCDLISALNKLDGLDDKEVKVLFPEYIERKWIVNNCDFEIQEGRDGISIYLRVIKPDLEDQSCMVGGHDVDCRCFSGFKPKWRER